MTPSHRFVADGTVVRLARILRFAGYDVRVVPDAREAHRAAVREGRILLTRNRRRFAGRPGVFVFPSEDLQDQLARVLRQFPQEIRPGKRCMVCNEELLPATRREVRGHVPLYVYLTARTFHRCPRCGRITWPGTHVTRMFARLHRALHTGRLNGSGSRS